MNIHNKNLTITRKRGIKRLSMRIKPDGSVAITCPWFVTDKEVANFVDANSEWIEKHQQKVADRKVLFEVGQTITTKFHTIELVQIENCTTRAVLKGNKVVITLSPEKEVESDQIQQFIRKVITEICRKEAQSLLPPRVSQLALEHGFAYNTVYIKNLKSKWGSCFSHGNINLNLHLMRLPDHLIDYIILHELCHTRHMNHAPEFWKLLNTVTNGKAQQLNKEINNYKGFFI